MSSDTNTLDSLVKHQIFLLRRGSGINNELIEYLENMRDELVDYLESHTGSLNAGRVTGMISDINDIIDSSLDGYSTGLIEKLEELTDYEAGFIERLLETNTSAAIAAPQPGFVSALTQNLTMNLVSSTGRTQTLTINEAINAFSSANKTAISNALRIGVANNDSSQSIVAAIKRLAEKRTQANAYALVRTATNAFTSAARQSVYDANSDVIAGLEWVSVLDSRTTTECALRDGSIFTKEGTRTIRTWPDGRKQAITWFPVTPRHWNCRSLLTPRIADEYRINVTGGTRASVGGPVSAQTTYSGWLSRQTASFQDEFLGVARGKLYRKGGLKLDQFVDDSGREYTLAELRALEPMAFESAGL